MAPSAPVPGSGIEVWFIKDLVYECVGGDEAVDQDGVKRWMKTGQTAWSAAVQLDLLCSDSLCVSAVLANTLNQII